MQAPGGALHDVAVNETPLSASPPPSLPPQQPPANAMPSARVGSTAPSSSLRGVGAGACVSVDGVEMNVTVARGGQIPVSGSVALSVSLRLSMSVTHCNSAGSGGEIPVAVAVAVYISASLGYLICCSCG